jgi:hypothetical protein
MLEKASKYKSNKVFKLVTGTEGDKTAWYIVLVDKIKEPIFKNMMQQSSYNLNDVGEILHSGWGNPPEELIKKYFG